MKRKFSHFSLLASVGVLAFGVFSVTACSSQDAFKPASVDIDVDGLELELGQSKKLSVKVSKGYSGQLRWFTSNENIAYVDSGYVFAVGVGEATISAAYGGGFDSCTVTVTDSGGGGGGETVSLTVSPRSKNVLLDETFTITATPNPKETTVSWISSDESIASITSQSSTSATILAVSAGSATITANGSNGKSATCSVTVSKAGGEGTDLDIAVPNDLGRTGEIKIGSPLNQTDFMKGLLADFNRLTHSNVSFTVTTFEEDTGTGKFPGPEAMPAVFPYASDQTLSFYQFQALSGVGKTDRDWIKSKMGQAAYNAASLDTVVGYPFAADNGYVMFYNKDKVSDPSEIDTIDKLYAKADSLGFDVNYSISNGFYGAGALMTFTGGNSLYHLTPTDSDYTVSSNFNSAEGLEAAKLIAKITNNVHTANASGAPTSNNFVLATIVDVSKVEAFKKQLGSNYACTALPYVDANRTTRLGNFLGYKFYGVNQKLGKTDKETAAYVAKFLCSEYCQSKRLSSYYVRPTLLSLQDEAANEPHIAALVEQERCNSSIPLTAISSELWSQTTVCINDIKALGANVDDSKYQAALAKLDAALIK